MREGGPESKALDRWTRVVIRLRWLVVAAWFVVFLVSGFLSGQLQDLFRSQAGVPGTESQRVNDILEDDFGQKSYAGMTLVVRAEGGAAGSLVPQVEQAAIKAANVLPTGEVVGVQTVSDEVVTATIASSLDVPDAKGYTEKLREAIGPIPGAETYLTGNAAIAGDLDPVFERDLRVGELFIALPIALLILIFVFGTLAFLLPFVFALVSIPTTLAFVWVFAHWIDMEQSVQNLVTFIGLGIAIDYSLLIVYRYRDELKKGLSREDAVAKTMQTAGRAVVFSGTAVAIGLALLLGMPVPVMKGFGLAGLLVPLISIAATLTLLPVLLYSLEARLDRVRLVPKRVLERRESADEHKNFWVAHAHRIMRRPVLFATAALVILLVLASPVLRMELGPGTNEVLPQNLESTQGLRILSAAVGKGALDPTEIIVDTGGAGRATQQGTTLAVANLVARLNSDPEVGLVQQPAGPGGIDPQGRFVRLQVTGKHDFGEQESEAFVDRLRDQIVPAMSVPAGTVVFVGGTAASGVDFLDKTYGAFPWLIGAVLLLTYFLLMRAFRSLLLPLKAIALNLLSIGAAYGLLVAAFKWGLGSPFGLIEYDQITGWIPVFLFAMLFGLSMDYEVFLVSRMREEWDATHDNTKAVSLGLAKTGRLVTAAGLIMCAAFGGFLAGSFVELQQFGLGLAAAILIDVTIVRALLLPSVMALMGRWNWYLPRWLARAVRVEPSPLEPKEAKPEAPVAAPI
jgi:uncharacterized membrane protein YdfJ with MMPL/SSD domain